MDEMIKKKILVIDDDPTLDRMLESVLSSHGYEVTSTTDAPEGLELAWQGHPDLIILDVMMPIINGFNICRLMKSPEGKGHIPIILLTSRTGEKDHEIGREVGADAYLTKPPDVDKLLVEMDRLLKAGSQESAA